MNWLRRRCIPSFPRQHARSPIHFRCGLIVSLAGCAFALALTDASRAPGADEPATSAVDFVRDIQPLLRKHCYECHGAETREAGLRLDRKDLALQGGDSGAVIVPGQTAESLLLTLINGDDPDRVMPPTGETLSSQEIELLKRWIADGASWPDGVDGEDERPTHWAYRPLRRAAPPDLESPLLRNPIDAFVQARLARENISPAPEADRYTLIKRLYYDLLGLPPSPEAVDRFVHNDSTDAYAELVDELLQSPHFGERWGRHWLDIARYADSDGYEKDRPRFHAWKYRDWVIQAVNDDLPFDRFTIEQLAGDLLSDPTPGQLLATAFNRQTLTNTEGGVDQEEFRCEAVFDRVETLGAAWLGLTVGCARCHSHKYDQISQREYYQLFAFFNNGDEATANLPTSPEAMEQYTTQLARWKTRLAELEDPLNKSTRRLQSAFEDWLAATTTELETTRRQTLTATSAEAESGAQFTQQNDGSWLVSGPRLPNDVYTLTLVPQATEAEDALPVTRLRLDVLSDPALPGQGPGRADHGNFVLSEITVDLQSKDAGDNATRPIRLKLAQATADFSQKSFEVSKAIDGLEDSSGWAVSPELGKSHWAEFTFSEPVAFAPDQSLSVRLSQQYGKNPHPIGRLRLTGIVGSLSHRESIPEEIQSALLTPQDQRDTSQKQALFEFFAARDPDWKKQRAAVDKHRKAQPFEPVIPAAILRERTQNRRTTHIFSRGSFLDPLGAVEPATLAILPPLAVDEGRQPTRLDLAEWLVSPENPLTPRVVVNRFWQHLFGQGLVKTSNDFGVRGEAPSHPELLDWLASEFIRLGWSRKELLRTILLSHTYRQSSNHRPELLDVDAENRLLARQNRFRVEGEIVRDLYLAASDMLQPRIGGPSVFPHLPPGIAELSYANNFKWGSSDWNTRPDNPHGVPPKDDLYRRGMYTFFKRTAAHPNLMNFDCPDANTTCVARRTSNTPLQALQTLNNEIFVDASRALAVRILSLDNDDDDARLQWMFRLCVARPPLQSELSSLASLLADARNIYSSDPEAAKKFVGTRQPAGVSASEAAAWITVARIVLNLDEFLTRE